MTSDQPLERAYAKVSRHILPLLMLGYVVAYLDRVNVGFAKLEMLDDLGFSETVYGLGAGIFFIGYFLFEVPSNIMLSRAGARRWIARIMISWGLLSAATMFVTTPAAFYAVRFLLGAAEAGFFPGVIFYLTLWYPAERRGRITAIFMSSIALCSVIGSVLAGLIMQGFGGIAGWAGWQWLFLIEGLGATLIGFVVLFRLCDNVASAPWLDAEQKALIAADLARDAATSVAMSLADAFRDARIWFAAIIYFCLIFGLYGLGFWLPTIISDMGIHSPVKIGLLGAIPYAIAAIGMVLAGRSADKRREYRWHVSGAAFLGAAGLLASVLLAHWPLLAVAGLSLAALGILTALPLFWALPTHYLRGAAAAAGIAIINSFGNLAGFASPYLIGFIKDATGSTASGVVTVAAFVFAGGVFFLIAAAGLRLRQA